MIGTTESKSPLCCCCSSLVAAFSRPDSLFNAGLCCSNCHLLHDVVGCGLLAMPLPCTLMISQTGADPSNWSIHVGAVIIKRER